MAKTKKDPENNVSKIKKQLLPATFDK